MTVRKRPGVGVRGRPLPAESTSVHLTLPNLETSPRLRGRLHRPQRQPRATCLVEPGSKRVRLNNWRLVKFAARVAENAVTDKPQATPSGRDLSNVAFHDRYSQRGRHDELGARDIRHAGLRFGPVRTRSEIRHAGERSSAGSPFIGSGEAARCDGATKSDAARPPGLHGQGDGRCTGQGPAKVAYRKLPAAPADLCAATVRRSRGFRAGDCPIAKRRAARTPAGGARRIQAASTCRRPTGRASRCRGHGWRRRELWTRCRWSARRRRPAAACRPPT